MTLHSVNLTRLLLCTAVAIALAFPPVPGRAQEGEPRTPEKTAEEKPDGRPVPPKATPRQPDASAPGREGERPSPTRSNRPDEGARKGGPREAGTPQDSPRESRPRGERGRPEPLPHLLAAAMHLEQAGLHDEARRVRARAEEMKRHHEERGHSRSPHSGPQLEEQLAEIRHRHEELRAEVAELREALQRHPASSKKRAEKAPDQ
jgi:hypothetical protein